MLLVESFPREYGGYRLTALLGSGGSADVYRAEIPSGGEVAIRRIARGVEADAEAQAILFEESRIWVALRHPNIVRVIDLGQHEGDWFLVLELVDGPTAEDLVLADGSLSIPEALLVTAGIAAGLGHAHALVVRGRKLDVVHRDVKPANVLVSRIGEVKLTDFGIARTNDRLGRTGAGQVRGSIHFMAPEQVRKEPLDARTDFFALGCTLHTLVTGRPLLDIPKESLLRVLHRGDVPPPDPSLPTEIRELIAWLAAPDPAKRPQRAFEVMERVRTLLPESDDAEVAAMLGARVDSMKTRIAEGSLATAVVRTDGEQTSPSPRTEKNRGE